MDTDRVDPAEVDLDVFCDERFSEPRTGAIIDSLILGIGRPPRGAAAAGPAPTEHAGKQRGSAVLRLSPDSSVDFPTKEEAERFLAAIAKVCDDFGLTCRWGPPGPTS